jgi:hypothetical protein
MSELYPRMDEELKQRLQEAEVVLNNGAAKDAPVAQLDRASGYEPIERKL